jgi:hypothetical protein
MASDAERLRLPTRRTAPCMPRSVGPRHTTLPRHLELFAQAVADGCNVRQAAKRSGRMEGSGGSIRVRLMRLESKRFLYWFVPERFCECLTADELCLM